MIKQNKGRDLDKVPKSRLVDSKYYVSKKYDGHYVQIKKDGTHIQMWTSGGKPFYLHNLGNYIRENFKHDFHIECEYNYNSHGYLGDRGKSAKLTTYRTNFEKHIANVGNPVNDCFTVLDIIADGQPFTFRLQDLTKMFEDEDWFRLPDQILVDNLEQAKRLAETWVKEGYEGAMLKSPSHMYQPGKRTNDIIKIKPRKTADLLCIGTKEGEGKYDGMLGALRLRDSKGRRVWVGSGLNDAQRELPTNKFIGQVVEIEYERIDETYVQPIIKHMRYDKTEEDID